MSDWKKLHGALASGREDVFVKLGIAEQQTRTIRSQLQPDYQAVAYAGMNDCDYPLWQRESLRENWLYLFDVDLEDYGYDVEPIIGQGLPKSSDGEGLGAVRYDIDLIDRFGCQIILRGHLKGASFELEGRTKQAFFCYFSALESVIESRRRAICGDGESDAIPHNDRLSDKVGKVVMATVPEGHGGLNSIAFWSSLRTKFKTMELLRNAIAHNERHEAPTEEDAVDAFVVLAIIIAMLHGGGSSAPSILGYYRIDPDRAASASRKGGGRPRRR